MRLGKTSLLFIALIGICDRIAADIPPGYHPMVIEPPFSLRARVFDLTPAIERARAEHKPLFIYLGASDCPPCRAYEAFLEKNQTRLRDRFSSVVVVNLSTRLAGRKLVFKVADKSYTFDEFRKRVGDMNPRLPYPYYWLLSPDLQQIKQLPPTLDDFMNVEGHRRLLNIQAN